MKEVSWPKSWQTLWARVSMNSEEERRGRIMKWVLRRRERPRRMALRDMEIDFSERREV